MPTPDVLRARVAETLAEHFPEATPTNIGLTMIAIRGDLLTWADEIIAERQTADSRA